MDLMKDNSEKRCVEIIQELYGESSSSSKRSNHMHLETAAKMEEDRRSALKEELEAINSAITSKLSLAEGSLALKTREIELLLITADTSKLNQKQRDILTKILHKINTKYSS